MNQVETVRLDPTAPAELLTWMKQFNDAANWLSGIAFREHLWHWLPLQRRTYRELRDRFQLPAAAAVVVIRKVASAYSNKTCRGHLARFRPLGAIPIYKHRYKRDGTVFIYGFRLPFAKARRRQRARLHNWAFGQLRQFIVYKAARAGVPVVFVDPANTSRTCPACGHVDELNRRSRAAFSCRRCGHAGPADVIAAQNIRAWARGDAPMVASVRAATSPLPPSREIIAARYNTLDDDSGRTHG